MKELDVYTGETSLKKKEEERQKNIKRIESELGNKQIELDNLDTYMTLEADSLNINEKTETMKAIDPNLISEMDIAKCHKSDTKNSKWVWSGNTTITNCRQPHGIVRKSRSTITRHQEDKLSKAISSLFPIKMIAILEWI